MIVQGWLFVVAVGAAVGFLCGWYARGRVAVVEIRKCDECDSREAKVCYRCSAER